jgi:ubiquinone/menaquinone biosynthesis C-methylase UbiE
MSLWMKSSRRKSRTFRLKLALAVVGALGFLFVADTVYEAARTLRQLDAIEAERDRWQRPLAVIAALDLKRGNTVVDLGCGAGYFALKLSSAVGPAGKVYAVDIRRLSLMFLWARSIRKNTPNITTVLGTADDPHLPSRIDAVLLANTYHELERPNEILDRVFESLVPRGRFVVVDPKTTEHGNLSATTVEDQLRRRGFDIVMRQDKFIDQANRGEWWLIVARRP